MSSDTYAPAQVLALRRRWREKQRYNHTHRRLRRALAPLVASGLANCVRCGELIPAGAAWDLGHDDRTGRHAGPEHAACNRGAPNRNQTSRVW